MEKTQPQGTHQQRKRPPGGWPSTAQPEQKPGRGIRRARKRLADRQKAYESIPTAWKGGAYRRPGSLKVR